MSEAAAGALFALAGIVIAVVQGGASHVVVTAWGERRTLQAGLLLFAVAFALLVPVGGWGLLVAGILVLVMGQGLISPSVSTGLAAVADPDRRGSTFGLSQSTGALSRLIGPIVATWLFDARGSGAPYVWGLVLSLAALAATGLLRSGRPRDEPIVTAG
jgi:MFS family permease